MVYLCCRDNGLLLAAFSSLVFAVCSLVVKQLDGTHPIQLCFYSFISVFLLSGVKVIKTREIILPRGCSHLIFIRSVCGCTFFVLSFYSVQLMPLGDASVLLYTTPLWTMILARIFVKEPCRTSNWIFVGIAMFGVSFVTQPEIIFGKNSTDESDDLLPSHKYTLGATAAILASISEAMGNVVLRKLKNINPSVILFNYSLFSISFCLVVELFFGYMTFPQSSSLFLIFILSILAASEQYLMGFALTLEQAGPVSIVQASDIIYGFILEVLFYNEEVNTLSLFGAFIVGIVVIQMALNKESSHSSKELVFVSILK